MRSILSILMLMGCSERVASGEDAKAAPSNVRNAAYPRVHDDLRVTFRVRAPQAVMVELRPGGDDNGLGGPLEMERSADGNWTVTTTPVTPAGTQIITSGRTKVTRPVTLLMK